MIRCCISSAAMAAGCIFFARPEVTGEILRRMDRIITYPVLLTALVVGVVIYVLRRTRFGRYTYAIGGNREACIRAGVPVERHIIKLYALSAASAGIAGFLSMLRFTAGSAVIGDPLLLSSIAAVIIGGVSLYGGSGSVVGTVIGALIIAVSNNRSGDAQCAAVLAVHRGWCGGDTCGAHRPVARHDQTPDREHINADCTYPFD